MGKSKLSVDLDWDAVDPPEAADIYRARVRARVRWGLAFVALLLLVWAGFMGWGWYQWTRSDAYQAERIYAQVPGLLDELEGMDSVNRWLAVAAIAHDPRLARARALAIKEPYHRLRALGRLSAALSRTVNIPEATVTRRELAEAARVLEASVAEIADPGRRAEAIKAIALAFCEAGMFEESLAVARRAGAAADGTTDRASLGPAWSRLAVELAKRGQSESAIALACDVNDPAMRLKALTEIAACPFAWGDSAREAARRALASAEQETDATRRRHALGEAATALAAVGMMEEARATAMRIEPKRARCDAFLAMLETRAIRVQPARADEAAIWARETAQELHEPEQRWAVLVRLARLLIVYQRMEQARETAMLLEQATDDLPVDAARRLGTATTVASILADAGVVDQAREAGYAAQEAARRISGPGARSAAMGAAARVLARAGDPGRARQTAILARDTAMRIEDPRIRDAALRTLCLAIASGDFGLELTQAFALQITDPENRYEALEAFLIVAIEAKKSDEAGPLAELARDAAARIGNPDTRSKDLLAVARAQLQLGLLDEAARTAKSITNPVSHSAASRAVARLLARKRRFREGREAAEACDQPVDRLEAFTTIIIEMTKAPKSIRASALHELEEPQGAPVSHVFPPRPAR